MRLETDGQTDMASQRLVKMETVFDGLVSVTLITRCFRACAAIDLHRPIV